MAVEPQASFGGARILIVDDEALVAMLLEDMLSDLGCRVVATASRVAHALVVASDNAQALDGAILDVNVAGESVEPVAAALAARGVPFVFATGYGQAGVPETWRDRPALQKPFSLLDVERTLREVLPPSQSL